MFPLRMVADVKATLQLCWHKKGVTTMLAGNMGQGAVNVLTAQGINVIRGCSGNIEEVVYSFIKGEISDSGEGCKAHESHSHDGHTCSH